MVLAGMGGWACQDPSFRRTAGTSRWGYAIACFGQLGKPDAPELLALADFPHRAPAMSRQPWRPSLASRLGSAGVCLLDGLLSWLPASRLPAAAVADHAFVVPERFELLSSCACFQGSRHPWNIHVGTAATEVVEWLRADPALQVGTPAFQALAVDFAAKRKNAKSEENRKFILAGALTPTCGTASMCSLSLAQPLALRRVRAWRLAFGAVNASALEAVVASARAAVRRLGENEQGKNGQVFLQQELAAWFASCGELVFVSPGSADAGFWAEPEHQDGGASVLHLGLTLFGRRTLVCRQGAGLPDVVVPNMPGTVYLGQLTGPHHQVTHEASAPEELLDVPGLGPCGVNIMMRTALFGFDRARLRNTSPSPAPLFAALTRTFREGFASARLRLPTLAECKAHDWEWETE